MKKVSFVIPCYGSADTLEDVVAELREIVETMPGLDYEIIMVNDASPDRVYEVITKICHQDPTHCKGIEFARNFGQHAALLAGYRETTGDVILSLDDDGQAPVESIPKMIEAIQEGADVVFGAYLYKKHSLWRNLGSRVNDLMAEMLLRKPRNLHLSSFFAAKRFIIDEVARYNNAYPYLSGLILRSSRNIVNVPVAHRGRQRGNSGYTVKKLLGLWINGFTAFSVVPLRFATIAGFICAFLGFLLGVWVIINKILHPDVPAGYSSMMAVIIFMGGMLMLMLGMIGEYVGRIYICLNKSPQYVVRSQTERK